MLVWQLMLDNRRAVSAATRMHLQALDPIS